VSVPKLLQLPGADPEVEKGGCTLLKIGWRPKKKKKKKKEASVGDTVTVAVLLVHIIPIYNFTDKLHCLMHLDCFITVITDCSIRVYLDRTCPKRRERLRGGCTCSLCTPLDPPLTAILQYYSNNHYKAISKYKKLELQHGPGHAYISTESIKKR